MKIAFEEKTHTYTHKETNEEYISVTTLIHKYVPVFDEDYWSLYKAIKDVLSRYNQFNMYKLSVGGWENVVAAWKQSPLIRYQSEVIDRQEEYLLQWEEKRNLACENGTAEHKRRENETSKIDYIEHGNITYETPAIHDQQDILTIQDFESDRIYTELLVFNDEHKLAGQVDKVKKNGKRVSITDYKTNEQITKQAFRDEMLLYPLGDLPNANWYIYNMQLSTYAWMLEQCGYEIERLELEHTRTNQIYEMQYLKEHVERMLNDYKEF